MGMGRPEFSIVVPVYNEGENIGGRAAQPERAVGGEHEILICYDFDADTTLPAIALDPPVPPRAAGETISVAAWSAIARGSRRVKAHSAPSSPWRTFPIRPNISAFGG